MRFSIYAIDLFEVHSGIIIWKRNRTHNVKNKRWKSLSKQLRSWSFDKQKSPYQITDFYYSPSSIYSWSIGHILEHKFFCLGHLGCAGSKGKKSGFEFFWATFEGGFFKFLRTNLKKKILKHFSNRIEKLHKIAFIYIFFFFLKKLKKEATPQILILSVIQGGAQ
jgi:hypothetical protein